MPRGQKACEKCGTTTGPRTKMCQCGHMFTFKPSFLKNTTFSSAQSKQTSFDELRRNDLVYIKQSTGPYWTNKNGERVNLGYSGKVKVREIYEDGFTAWSEREGCFAFIYMGPQQKSKNGITMMSPHKIRKIAK